MTLICSKFQKENSPVFHVPLQKKKEKKKDRRERLSVTLRGLAMSQPVKTAKRSCGFSLQRRPVFFVVVVVFFPDCQRCETSRQTAEAEQETRSGTAEELDDDCFSFSFLIWGQKCRKRYCRRVPSHTRLKLEKRASDEEQTVFQIYKKKSNH